LYNIHIIHDKIIYYITMWLYAIILIIQIYINYIIPDVQNKALQIFISETALLRKIVLIKVIKFKKIYFDMILSVWSWLVTKVRSMSCRFFKIEHSIFDSRI